MKRIVIIGGREILIAALGQPMDREFDRLHAAYFGNTPLPWEEFVTAAIQYFDNNPTPFAAHDAYFNCFTVIWQTILETGRYEHAEHIWERALVPALEWERSHPQHRIHKGTPYYFWAMTALLRGDTDRGYILIHRAVREDVDSSREETPNTPGFALVSLNYENVHQAFRQWVLSQAAFLETLITDYNATQNRTLTLAEVRRRFLNNPPTIEALFLFTYCLARLMKLGTLPDHVTDNPFAGQLQLNLLFDITLVIDAAIKAKDNERYFPAHARTLLDAVGTPLTDNQLKDEINGQFNGDFDATLEAALNASLMVRPNQILTRLQCDVALAYGLRNHGAHNTGTAPTVWNRFPEVQTALFRTLFAVIEHLY
jgi:hypothetical protein